MTYFESCNDLNSIKAEYKRLAKLFHPDISGRDTTAEMQAINEAYLFACAHVLKSGTFTAQEQESEIINAKEYAEALSAVLNLQGITIELCGAWLWISGKTYEHHKALSAAKFRFASKKKEWYFRGIEYAQSSRGKTKTKDEIRAKYGSQQITGTYKSRPNLGA